MILFHQVHPIPVSLRLWTWMDPLQMIHQAQARQAQARHPAPFHQNQKGKDTTERINTRRTTETRGKANTRKPTKTRKQNVIRKEDEETDCTIQQVV